MTDLNLAENPAYMDETNPNFAPLLKVAVESWMKLYSSKNKADKKSTDISWPKVGSKICKGLSEVYLPNGKRKGTDDPLNLICTSAVVRVITPHHQQNQKKSK